MSTTRTKFPQILEIDAVRVSAVLFTADGEHLLVGGESDIQVLRVKDGKQLATMPAKTSCIAASSDGRWIAAADVDKESETNTLFVWDTAATYKRVLAHKMKSTTIVDVDFSPDSRRLVWASNKGEKGAAVIWDIAARKKVRTLNFGVEVDAVKYSPLQGDRIAIATEESVQVWDCNHGSLLVDVEVQLGSPSYLLWHHDHLFVRTEDDTINKIIAATGSTVSQWPFPDDDELWGIALSRCGRFIACSVEETITFWNTETNTELGFLKHTDGIHSISLSPDDQLLAFAGERKIVLKDVSSLALGFVSEPKLDIDSVALEAWRCGQLENAESLLSAAIPTSKNAHHVFASRALVRSRLGHWDAALVDAEESIEIQPSAIGYIATCVALVGKGETDRGCAACDIAFMCCPSMHASLLLLVKVIALFMAGKHVDAISRTNDLIADGWADPALNVIQTYMHISLGNKYRESGDYERAIQSFKDAQIKLSSPTRRPPRILSLITGWEFDDLANTVQQSLCDALFASDRIKEAGELMLRMVNQGINVTESSKAWFSDFKYRCHKLEALGDSFLDAEEYDEAISLYTVALSLDPASSQSLLIKRYNARVRKGAQEDALNDVKEWVRLTLVTRPWKDVFVAATDFKLERLAFYWIVCEQLQTSNRVIDAIACFHQIWSEQAQEIDAEANEFKPRYCRKFEDLGDSAVIAKLYDEAVSQYTTALSLGLARPQDLLVKRSRAYAESGKWEDAFNDANEVIKLDPSSPSGYERKHVALLGMRHYHDAVDAFETMLSKISRSSDPNIREQSRHYVRPEETEKAIRKSIKKATQDSPLVLINALSGRLCNKTEQEAAFESTPAFTMLIASMTTCIDDALIDQVVGEFYRYATFSHTWSHAREGKEPLYENVIKIVVYDLEASHTHNKLQTFCKIVRDEGFNWAWSDTCCIDKGDHFILQEALVSMFKWYEGSALTIIFLCDVDRLAEIGALMDSRWNSRGWTFQEYHASKVVRIYTKDWTPYLGLTIHNHKESPEVISEMEKATGISAQALVALRPGWTDIREKLRLASTRQTTRVEDAAYSLLGIFSMTLPVTYGEGDKALGRLLSGLLSNSGDTSILAWTGRPGSFNTCLPADIRVFSQPLTSHIPPAIPDVKMAATTDMLRDSSLDNKLVTELYDELKDLSLPQFVVQRMKLPCLSFEIKSISSFQNGSEVVFRAQTDVLGVVEIKTKQKLTEPDSLRLVHPWIDFLLDRQAARKVAEIEDKVPSFHSPSGTAGHLDGDSLDKGKALSPNSPSKPSKHLDVDPLDENALTRVSDAGRSRGLDIDPPDDSAMSNKHLEFLARLSQPFGALLLSRTRRNVDEYERISTQTLITVQVKKITSTTLEKLKQGARVLDVL